jgi:site-specific recombinase XerD
LFKQGANAMSSNDYLSSEQVLSILQVASEFGTRELCMFALAFQHGMRASEIANLKLVDIQHGQVLVRRCKKSMQTRQPLQSHANPLLNEPAILDAWLAERGETDSPYLFTSRQDNGKAISRRQVYNLFESCALQAGIPHGMRNPHQLKHALASLLTRNGVTLAYVQQALGHTSISSTVRYTHVSQSEAAAKVSGVMQAVYA